MTFLQSLKHRLVCIVYLAEPSLTWVQIFVSAASWQGFFVILQPSLVANTICGLDKYFANCFSQGLNNKKSKNKLLWDKTVTGRNGRGRNDQIS